jgi:hypothetical protein
MPLIPKESVRTRLTVRAGLSISRPYVPVRPPTWQQEPTGTSLQLWLVRLDLTAVGARGIIPAGALPGCTTDGTWPG